ncbi:MAG: Nramp family divalent metal transporter [Pseudomonadota bacterium]|nr:Nramp family divalent metal transporter [Pseudomonadota bacterium]
MQEAPKTFLERLKFIGPSVVVTGSVVGSGSIVMTPLLGAAAGFMLLWWLLLSMWSKPIIQAEIARYIVVSKKTFLEAFADMPGFKTTIQGKTTSWLVWFMFIGVIPSIAGMGGLAGAVAEAGNTMFPFLTVEIWVVISCLVTWMLLYFGSYKSLEKTLLVMVLFFSFMTMIIAIAMQSTDYQVSVAQVSSGLSFSFPSEYLPLALAVFGFTGISYGEIMAYTYWCLEKGYAENSGNNVEETKHWIKTMQTDVWVTVFFITLGTLPFFFLGAGILYNIPELQQALATSSFWDIDVISSLQNMFSLVLGGWAKWLFIVLAFFVLFSTLLSGTAAFTRTISDYLISMGLVKEQANTRKKLIKLIAFLIPFLSGLFYFVLPNPFTLLLIAGIWAAMGLPIVNIGALYLVNKLEPELQPKITTKFILWASLVLQLSMAVLIIDDILLAF